MYTHAGITSIGSSVQVWYNQTTTNYGTHNAGNDYAYLYLKNLVSGMRAGEALNAARSAIPVIAGMLAEYQNMTAYLLYGDPSIGINTYGLSSTVLASIPSSKAPGKLSIHTDLFGKELSIRFETQKSFTGKMSVYQLDGKLLSSREISNQANSIPLDPGRKGIVVVRGEVTLKGESPTPFTQRMIIK